jgi:hypothetical protein
MRSIRKDAPKTYKTHNVEVDIYIKLFPSPLLSIVLLDRAYLIDSADLHKTGRDGCALIN